MITVIKNKSVFSILLNGVEIALSSTMRGERILMYFDKRDCVDANDFTLKNVKNGGIYELLLKYFPELRLGVNVEYKGF